MSLRGEERMIVIKSTSWIVTEASLPQLAPTVEAVSDHSFALRHPSPFEPLATPGV